ncbi:MAG: type II secretion system secretin GspD [Caulobacter sp.]|nr:type II secretion system secretin GspD [Caulobacter sp.]
MPASAAVQPRAAASPRAEAYTFVFREADIAQVVEEVLGNALGLTYAIDPGVNGKMSFRIDQRLTRTQLFDAIETALAANDVALVRDGETVKVLPRSKAGVGSGVRSIADGAGRRAGYDVVAVPLSYVSPTEVAKALEAMAPANTVLYANDKQGLLILGGIGAELESAQETIKVLDRSAFEGSRLRWFDLNQAPVATVATEVDRLLQAGGMSTVTVVPLRRLNGLIVFARTSQALDEVGRWIARLDTAGRENASPLHVYRPRSVSAEDLGATLGSVISGRGDSASASGRAVDAPVAADGQSGSTSSGAVSASASTGSGNSGWSGGEGDDEVRIGISKSSNSLLISASPSRWAQIQRILGEIDRPVAQVLIEASILEVRLGNDLKYGVDWKAVGDGGKLGVGSVYNDKGAVGPSFPGFSVTYLSKDISAAISALGSKTDVEVVSAPKIVTLDNHAAKLQIGDQVPVVTQSAQNTSSGTAALINTVDYRNTGVILNVTPRVTGDNRVVLEVTQEVSSVAKTLTSGIDSPTIQQRKFESTLVLDSGAVVALGGLISRSRTQNGSGTPGLSKIPGLGVLFRSDTRESSRTELIVLLTARIVPDRAGADSAMGGLLSDLPEIKNRGLVPPPR